MVPCRYVRLPATRPLVSHVCTCNLINDRFDEICPYEYTLVGKQAYMSSLHRLKKCGCSLIFVRVIHQRKFSVCLLDGRFVALRLDTKRQVRVLRQPPHGRRQDLQEVYDTSESTALWRATISSSKRGSREIRNINLVQVSFTRNVHICSGVPGYVEHARPSGRRMSLACKAEYRILIIIGRIHTADDALLLYVMSYGHSRKKCY